MKKVLAVLAAVSLCGCTTFGTFANFEKGETTKEEVRSVLGEPEDKLFESEGEVWQYHFIKRGKEEARSIQTVMNLAVKFKEDVVDNYTITVSKEPVKEEALPIKEPPPPAGGGFPPPVRPKGGFIERFDKDNDSLVSREEFTARASCSTDLTRIETDTLMKVKLPRVVPRECSLPAEKEDFNPSQKFCSLFSWYCFAV